MPFSALPTQSLAFAPARAELVVRRIPFDSLRLHCADQGLHEGDHVFLSDRSTEHLLLEQLDGREVLLEKLYGALIEVDVLWPAALGR